MPNGTKSSDDKYSEQETTQRRDAVIKQMLNTPPKPHFEMKIGKPREKRGKSHDARKPRLKRSK